MTLTPLWPDFSRARVHRKSSMPTGDATAADGSDDMRRYLGARGETRSGATLKSGLVWRELARTTGLSGSLLESCGCFVRILNVLETMSVHEPLAEAMCVCEVLPCLQLVRALAMCAGVCGGGQVLTMALVSIRFMKACKRTPTTSCRRWCCVFSRIFAYTLRAVHWC